MLAFLFLDEVVYRPGDVAKVLIGDGLAVVAAAHEALAALSDWTTAAIEEALRVELVEELGIKPRHAFGPVRVADHRATNLLAAVRSWSCSAGSSRWRGSPAPRDQRREGTWTDR